MIEISYLFIRTSQYFFFLLRLSDNIKTKVFYYLEENTLYDSCKINHKVYITCIFTGAYHWLEGSTMNQIMDIEDFKRPEWKSS